jgi:hypothetical protein
MNKKILKLKFMIRILNYSLLILPFISMAQNNKYQLETSLAWSHHFSNRYPIGSTSIGNVKPSYHINLRNFKINWQLNLNEQYSCGLNFFNHEFEYGYKPANSGVDGGFSITTGMNWTHYYTRIIQWNVEPFIKRYFVRNEKNKIFIQAGVQFGWLPFSNIFNDTNFILQINNDPNNLVGANDHQRENFISTKFIKFPAYQDNKVKVLLGVGFGYEHKINKHLGYAFSLNYRQGFSTFFNDDTQIWVDYFTSPKSEHFHTKINGSGLLLNYTFVYYFKEN